MRAERKLRILKALRAAGRDGLTDREIGSRLGENRHTVAAVRRELVREGLVLQIKAPVGSHYPIAGWRHRDHATEAERAEADRGPAAPPSLFGERVAEAP